MHRARFRRRARAPLAGCGRGRGGVVSWPLTDLTLYVIPYDVNLQCTTREAGMKMKAMMRERYGSPAVIEPREGDTPKHEDDEVLVRVRAASVNRFDWYSLAGTPWIARPMTGVRGPKSSLFGADFAGTIESVGAGVTDLQPGDEVYGCRDGAYAEFVQAKAGVALKPENLTFEEAACVPMAGLTALQGLRDHGKLEPGQHVLVNGASGGVGTFAVQIAKALGAEVTAVCSTRNVGLARSLGADHGLHYPREA